MSGTCFVPFCRCCCAAAAAAVALKRATSRASSFAMCASRFFRVAACSSHCFSCQDSDTLVSEARPHKAAVQAFVCAAVKAPEHPWAVHSKPSDRL